MHYDEMLNCAFYKISTAAALSDGLKSGLYQSIFVVAEIETPNMIFILHE
jgi:hypothetical protein